MQKGRSALPTCRKGIRFDDVHLSSRRDNKNEIHPLWWISFFVTARCEKTSFGEFGVAEEIKREIRSIRLRSVGMTGT